ncbi:hypothetical protein SRCM100623_00974 [Acetobacter pasteurianus]|uniref:Uncharacterized protein n=1 Tax=Acetobacter pasteurianus TaxID=438 RepID=A0A1A0DBM7_ACEPA|nr:hypothetical protein SRCM100623_00974 [Acetobacter pasteurianus]
MKRVILPFENDGRISVFVAERLGCLFYPPFEMFGLEENGQIIGGIILNCFEGTDIHATVVGGGWTRKFLRLFGWYLFEHLGVLRFTGITEQPNVIDIMERLGGQREGVLRNHFGAGRNGIVLGVLAEEYRYFQRGKHAQSTIGFCNGAGPISV